MQNQLTPLCVAIKNQDVEAIHDWKKSEHWRTVEEIIAAQGEAKKVHCNHDNNHEMVSIKCRP